LKRDAMIYDCFSFWKELDVLELRLNILDKYVDKFVIAESNKTHSGNDKPLYFQDNKERFSKFLHKIVVVNYESYSNINPWINETGQRNSCLINCIQPNDIVIVSDLDEIPNPHLLTTTSWVEDDLLYHLKQTHFMYNLKTVQHNPSYPNWYGSRICRRSAIGSRTLSELRSSDQYAVSYVTGDSNRIILNGGWHFAYFGDDQFIKSKIEAMAHQELNVDYIKNCLPQKLKDRKNIYHDDSVITYTVDINCMSHPQYIIDNINSSLVRLFT